MLIELRNICKTYLVGESELPVLRGISLDVAEGEYVALMGSSGSGKTTLMNLLGSLDNPTSGEFTLAGVDVPGLSPTELAQFRSRSIGFVFQNFNLLPRTSALDNVLLPTLYAGDQRTTLERHDYACELLEMVGLGGRLDHTPNQLSGGERQRVAIARALINRPKLLLADEPTGNLDTRTEQEILDIFQRLNEDHHITLIVVTHDTEVADRAARVIHLKDGVIDDDVVKRETPRLSEKTSAATGEDSTSPNIAASQKIAATVHAVAIATLALRRNLLRTMLTMLGVIIGVASVVTVMELSAGATSAIEDTVASMGASMLTVTASSGGGGRHKQSTKLTPADVQAVSTACPAVRVAAPLLYARLQLVRGNRRCLPRFAFGTSPEYLPARNWEEMQLGQSFNQRDVDDVAKVCVIGQTVMRELFEDEYPIGEEIRVNGVSLKVVGVLSAKGGDVTGNDQDDIVITPWTTLKYRINSNVSTRQTAASFSHQLPSLQLVALRQSTRNEQLHQIYVQAHSPAEVAPARRQIRQVLGKRNNVNGRDAYQINDMTEVSKVTRQVVGGLSALGLVIAGVSLLVGGVGIMNIMLVSVTERTREIGLRMAVGADRGAILRQFLIEAIVLCLLGGVIGIVIGHFGSMIVASFIGWPTAASLWAPVVAVSVAATVAIVFGFYPARKASRLNPINALRYE